MDTTVLAALIGGGAVILAAVIPILLQRRLSDRGRTETLTAPVGRTATEVDVSGHEAALRQDSRVQRLLGNSNWRDAAEAAIAYFCRGVSCPVESWRRSSTWQQVAAVHTELVGAVRAIANTRY